MKIKALWLALALTVLLVGIAAAQDAPPTANPGAEPVSAAAGQSEPGSPLLALARSDGMIHEEDIDAPLREFLRVRARCVFETLSPPQLTQRLSWVTELDLSPYRGTLTDARWLYMFENLTSVKITDAALADLTVIGSFSSLTELTLLNCGVFDLTPLQTCKKLSSLTLGWTDDYLAAEGAFDLTPLQGMKNLDTLALYGSVIRSLEPLAKNAKQYRALTLSDTSIGDIGTLRKFTKLSRLTLDLLHSTAAADTLRACPQTLKALTLSRIILNADAEDAVKGLRKLTDYTLTDCDAANELFYENLAKSATLTLSSVSLPNGAMIGEVYADKTDMILRDAPEALVLYMLANKAPYLKTLAVDLEALTPELNAALRKRTSLNTLTIGLKADADLAGDAWGKITGVRELTIESEGKTLLSTDFLRELVNLNTLTLSGLRTADTAGLASLSRLGQLNLYGCRIADWSFLDAMQGLKTVKAYACGLTGAELGHFAALRALDDLRLNGNEIESIALLTASPTLRRLDILDNPIADFTPLLLMPALRSVYSGQSGVITDNRILVRSVYIDTVDYQAIADKAFGGETAGN